MAIAGEQIRQEAVLVENGFNDKQLTACTSCQARSAATFCRPRSLPRHPSGGARGLRRRSSRRAGVGPVLVRVTSVIPTPIRTSTGLKAALEHSARPASTRSTSNSRLSAGAVDPRSPPSLPQGSSTTMAGATLATLSNVMKNFYLNGPFRCSSTTRSSSTSSSVWTRRTWRVSRPSSPLHNAAPAASARAASWRPPGGRRTGLRPGHVRPRVPLRSRAGLGPGDPQDPQRRRLVPAGDEG
jgi:hypothetical protein